MSEEFKNSIVSISAFGLSFANITEALQILVLFVGLVSGVIGIANGIKNRKRK